MYLWKVLIPMVFSGVEIFLQSLATYPNCNSPNSHCQGSFMGKLYKMPPKQGLPVCSIFYTKWTYCTFLFHIFLHTSSFVSVLIWNNWKTVNKMNTKFAMLTSRQLSLGNKCLQKLEYRMKKTVTAW